MQPLHDDIRSSVANYYTSRLHEHGSTAKGVDWRDTVSQELRFAQFGCLWSTQSEFSVNDLGCGYGHLLSFLRVRGFCGHYTGIDVSPAMIDAAHLAHQADTGADFALGARAPAVADYTVASGVFNVRREFSEDAWNDYMRATIAELHRASSKGFGFNVLSIHSDAEKRRADLHYADPGQWLDYCATTYSRHVTLLQDYDLYEFTLLVRL
jgi:SAM-dependent methyltransferase